MQPTHDSPSSPPKVDPWIGRVVDSRYRIVECIGKGGMGVVYKVEHVRIGKIAALKMLHRALCSVPSVIKRFQIEAEAISRLNHPNIVQVFDFGQVEETLFLVMEYLHGENLGTILKRDGPVPLERCVAVLSQVCDALSEAHALGIVHRDLKPENIQISRTRSGDDFVKVVDFGLAKMIQERASGDTTSRNNVVGTPYYMAPEQIRGRPLDQRCDIYSLGALAYRMLTGRHAFVANSPVGVLTKHITEEAVPPSRSAPTLGLPREIDLLTARAMAKSPEDRFADAQAMKAALHHSLLCAVGSSSSTGDGPSAVQTTPQRRISDSGMPRDLAFAPTGPMESMPEPPPLSRADLAFERRLRRMRLVKLLTVLVLLGAAAVGFYYLALREAPEHASMVEIEPNNDPRTATLIASGKPVVGYLGKRTSKEQSDRDWYRFVPSPPPNARRAPLTLLAKVSAVPNMDITLELFNHLGERLGRADHSGRGKGEVITNWTLDPGQHYYLLVREVWRVGTPPTENVTDAYRLSANWQVAPSGWEREPNDQPRQAQLFSAHTKLRAFLGLSDHDHFLVRVGTAKQRSRAVISGIPDVDLIVDLYRGDKKLRSIDEGGVSKGETVAGIARSMRLVVRRKHDKKDLQREAVGLLTPYTIELTADTP